MPPVQPMEIITALGVFAALAVFVVMALVVGVIALVDEAISRRRSSSVLRRIQEEM